jgi:hypothetical protein
VTGVRWCATGLTALAVFATAPASPQEGAVLTTEKLLSICDEGSTAFALCLGLINGASSIMMLNCDSWRYDSAEPMKFLSASDVPSVDAAVHAFRNWANNNPARWGDSANLGIATSLSLAFPCK